MAAAGAAGVVRLDDGTEMRPKGWQHVPAGRRLVLELPGGGGYGEPAKRSAEARARTGPRNTIPTRDGELHLLALVGGDAVGSVACGAAKALLDKALIER